MLAFLGNLGPLELILIVVVAVLIFGKDLPQAASKAYLQVRKLRNAVDDLRRDSGIDRELRDIERNVREAEWEARRTEAPRSSSQKAVPRAASTSASADAPASPHVPAPPADPSEPPAAGTAEPPEEPKPSSTTGEAS